MRIGVPITAGLDPVSLAILERMVQQANAELALAGDPRRLDVVRLAAESAPVRLWGGLRVTPDALFRESPGLDVIVAIGPAEPDAGTPRDEEAVVGYLRRARSDVQHVLAVGEGVRWVLEAGIGSGRRVVLNQISPAVRARFDAAVAAQTDPARDGDLWSASDPLRFMLLLLEFFADLGGFQLPDRIRMRIPWTGLLVRALMPRAEGGPSDDEDDGIAATHDVDA